MRAVDDFLALPIVSLKVYPISSLLIEKEGPETLALFCNCKNATHLYGPPS